MTLQKPAPGAAVVLITGATGYIGGRLVRVLEGAGVRLRCLARHPDALASRVSQTTQGVAGDLLAFALTRWSDAPSSGGVPPSPADTRLGGGLVDLRQVHVSVDADRAFAPIATIGGERGWYFGTWLWRIRGAVDLLMGGVGMGRGRRDPEAPAGGDALDFIRS